MARLSNNNIAIVSPDSLIQELHFSREKTMAEVEAIVVGGGPAGIAT